MILSIIRRFVFGIALIIPIALTVFLISLIPVIVFIIAFIIMIYCAGSMVDDEIKFRKRNKNEPYDWGT